MGFLGKQKAVCTQGLWHRPTRAPEPLPTDGCPHFLGPLTLPSVAAFPEFRQAWGQHLHPEPPALQKRPSVHKDQTEVADGSKNTKRSACPPVWVCIHACVCLIWLEEFHCRRPGSEGEPWVSPLTSGQVGSVCKSFCRTDSPGSHTPYMGQVSSGFQEDGDQMWRRAIKAWMGLNPFDLWKTATRTEAWAWGRASLGNSLSTWGLWVVEACTLTQSNRENLRLMGGKLVVTDDANRPSGEWTRVLISKDWIEAGSSSWWWGKREIPALRWKLQYSHV